MLQKLKNCDKTRTFTDVTTVNFTSNIQTLKYCPSWHYSVISDNMMENLICLPLIRCVPELPHHENFAADIIVMLPLAPRSLCVPRIISRSRRQARTIPLQPSLRRGPRPERDSLDLAAYRFLPDVANFAKNANLEGSFSAVSTPMCR